LNVEVADDHVAKARLKADMQAFFTQRAKFMFGEEVAVEIDFEEGSLITKLRVVGNAATVIFLALNAYGGFRQAVDYLARDSTLLAQSANLEMVFRTKAAYCDRVRIEKRKGIFGRVNELLGELDSINRSVGDSVMPRTAIAVAGFEKGTTERLLEWDKQAHKLFSKLDHDETKACVSAGLLEELERFPLTVPWANEFKTQSFRATMAASDPQQAGLLDGAATRYRATVLSIRKAYAETVKQYAPVKG
jgi:hypothetical protein